MAAWMSRHNPQTRRLTELVAEGAIGRLRLVRTAFSFFLGGPENVRVLADPEGGALFDVGGYCISGLPVLAGEARRAFGGPTARPGRRRRPISAAPPLPP